MQQFLRQKMLQNARGTGFKMTFQGLRIIFFGQSLLMPVNFLDNSHPTLKPSFFNINAVYAKKNIIRR